MSLIISMKVPDCIVVASKSSKSGWIRAGQAIPLVPYGYKQASFS